METLSLVLGDQLFDGLPGMPSGVPVFMREDIGLCRRVRHHKQKLVLFLSAMRAFRRRLAQSGVACHYEKLDPSSDQAFLEGLAVYCREQRIGRIFAYEPADPFFNEALARADLPPVELVANPAFVTRPETWRAFREETRAGKMGDFYIRQRRDLGVLVDGDGRPEGGRWSLDTENRKPLPKNLVSPQTTLFEPGLEVREVAALVEAVFPDHPGRALPFQWPVTHEQARQALADFVATRLADFGPYEDVVSSRQAALWHSRLSSSINLGLIRPMECVEAAVGAYQDGFAPLNSVEGFVRQIIGWREFVWQVDREYDQPHGPWREFLADSRTLPGAAGFNALGHYRRLGPAWWKGTTGLPPIDTTIHNLKETAWCHHIERLMVTGAVMMMCEVAPGDAYRWFMEMFVDSADWVMRPNVLGMGQFADGGYFATKPYFSGSAYILKMSDYPRGDWCDVWDGLYWRFVGRNRQWMARNPRTAQAVSAFDRLKEPRKARILDAAEEFIGRVTLTGD
ncbi:MAG: cryptochrome/photolyase family protein [Fimbriimonadaceae bacterium]|nr:cryptochrome/photolyase family protein [Fimbriimonadaceae bacterium]QYK56738.1 MAG: cryptochrome/photolyase family protein [Fimbriimonadaceae bacterium]